MVEYKSYSGTLDADNTSDELSVSSDLSKQSPYVIISGTDVFDVELMLGSRDSGNTSYGDKITVNKGFTLEILNQNVIKIRVSQNGETESDYTISAFYTGKY